MKNFKSILFTMLMLVFLLGTTDQICGTTIQTDGIETVDTYIPESGGPVLYAQADTDGEEGGDGDDAGEDEYNTDPAEWGELIEDVGEYIKNNPVPKGSPFTMWLTWAFGLAMLLIGGLIGIFKQISEAKKKK